MSPALRAGWQRLRNGEPGRRFQDRYRASRQGDRRGLIGRIVRFVAAGVAVAIGIVLVFIPGPAILFFAVAGMLLATESLAVARFLDWSEVTLRRLTGYARRTWCAWPLGAKITAGVIAAAVVGAAALAVYRLMFD